MSFPFNVKPAGTRSNRHHESSHLADRQTSGPTKTIVIPAPNCLLQAPGTRQNWRPRHVVTAIRINRRMLLQVCHRSETLRRGCVVALPKKEEERKTTTKGGPRFKTERPVELWILRGGRIPKDAIRNSNGVEQIETEHFA
ncbi:unnamed protein product [Calypogeia fissa]